VSLVGEVPIPHLLECSVVVQFAMSREDREDGEEKKNLPASLPSRPSRDCYPA
jgi:hypothetical protein